PQTRHAFVDAVLKSKFFTAESDQQVSIPLGNLQLDLQGIVQEEPDRGGSLFQLAPRLMINYDDLGDSGLLGPASRARYRFLVAGEAASVESFRDWAVSNLPVGARIIDIENARPELRTALDRGHRFLSLATLCASLLAGIAILLATRRYVNLAIDAAAIMRTIGMTSHQVMNRHVIEILQVLVFGTLIGILLGYLGQHVLSSLVGNWFGEGLPQPGFRPVLIGLFYGAVLLPGFSLPVLLRIRKVSPLRVLRRDIDPPDASSLFVWGLAVLSFAVLVFWQVQDYRLAVALMLALLSVMLISVGIGRLFILLLKPSRNKSSGLGLGLAALSRHASLTQWQLAGFSVGITLLLILGVVRLDLINTWTTSLSPIAPNHFLINIQPDEQQPLQQWFEENNVINSGMYASARGRLTHIDGNAVNPDAFETDRGKRLASREFSLGFSDELQMDNRVVAGDQWPPLQNGFTVEQDLASHLGLKPGSTMTFDIAGQQVTAPVISLRSISWDSFNVNFFVQGSEKMMMDLPVAYLNSIYLNEDPAGVMKKLATDYPAVSILDLRPLLKQIRDIMDKGALAIETVFLFTLLAAVLVTLGAVLISKEERAQEIAVLRTVGASRKQVLLGVLAEFGLMGLISGLVAASLASITGYLVAIRLFGLAPVFNPLLWVTGLGIGVVTLLIVGYLSTRSLLNKPPLSVINAGV
ncbi:MAG: FtsX-like permease family protein, partial [Gammaproteobacteria bacterium]|nr:FtsX-like permease family protein [Gammaproteobacteria bacterium]